MDELIDTTGIAAALGMRREYVRDRLVKRPDFPRPALATTQRQQRWSRESLEKWLASQQRYQNRGRVSWPAPAAKPTERERSGVAHGGDVDLAAEAHRWNVATEIRHYVAAIESARMGADAVSARSSWVARARQVADGFDPSPGRLASFSQASSPTARNG